MVLRNLFDLVVIGGIDFMYFLLSVIWSAFMPVFDNVYEAVSGWWTYSVLPIKEDILKFMDYLLYGVISPLLCESLIIWGYTAGSASLSWLLFVEIAADIVIVFYSYHMITNRKTS